MTDDQTPATEPTPQLVTFERPGPGHEPRGLSTAIGSALASTPALAPHLATLEQRDREAAELAARRGWHLPTHAPVQVPDESTDAARAAFDVVTRAVADAGSLTRADFTLAPPVDRDAETHALLTQTVAELDRGLTVLASEAKFYVRAPGARRAMLDTIATLRLALASQDALVQALNPGRSA